MNGGNFFFGLMLTLVVIMIIFLICREIVCWYFKINERLAVLQEIRDLLEFQKNAAKLHLDTDRQGEQPAIGTVAAAADVCCPFCDVKLGAYVNQCPNCKVALSPDMYGAQRV